MYPWFPINISLLKHRWIRYWYLKLHLHRSLVLILEGSFYGKINLTLTPRECYDVSNRRQLDYLFNSLLKAGYIHNDNINLGCITYCHMGVMASQITRKSSVCSTVNTGQHERCHQRFTLLAICGGIHRWPVDFPNKGPVTPNTVPCFDTIMGWSSEKYMNQSNTNISWDTRCMLDWPWWQRHWLTWSNLL